MKRAASIFAVLIMSAYLAGCSSNTPAEQTTTASIPPSDMAEPATHTNTPTVEPSATPRITSTSPPSPPPSPTLSPLVISRFVFERNPPDCILPCWQGLKIGISKLQDVDEALNRVFGFYGEGYLYAGDYGAPQGYRVMGNWWDRDPTDSDDRSIFFNALALVSDDTNTLEGINFNYDSFETPEPVFDFNVYPQRIIRELGWPSAWDVTTQVGGQGNLLDVTHRIIYDSGIIFVQSFSLPLLQKESEQSNLSSAFLCLGSNVNAGQATRISIGEPFINGYADLSPSQDWTYYGRSLTRVNDHPIQNLFKLSQEELMTRIIEENNPCVKVTVYNP